MEDKISKMLSKILNILFLYNIVGTTYGGLVGIFLLSIQDVIAIYIPFVGLIKWYGFIVFGVLVFNIKPLVKRKYEDPKMEMSLKYMREAIAQGNFSEKEIRQLWREYIVAMLKEISVQSNDTVFRNNTGVTE